MWNRIYSKENASSVFQNSSSTSFFTKLTEVQKGGNQLEQALGEGQICVCMKQLQKSIVLLFFFFFFNASKSSVFSTVIVWANTDQQVLLCVADHPLAMFSTFTWPSFCRKEVVPWQPLPFSCFSEYLGQWKDLQKRWDDCSYLWKEVAALLQQLSHKTTLWPGKWRELNFHPTKERCLSDNSESMKRE